MGTKDTNRHYRGWFNGKVHGINLGANKRNAIKFAKNNSVDYVMLYPGQNRGENTIVWNKQ